MRSIPSGYVGMHGVEDRFLRHQILWLTYWPKGSKVGSSSNGPPIRRPQALVHNHFVAQYITEPFVEVAHTVSLDSGPNIVISLDPVGFGLGPPSPISASSDLGPLSSLHCDEWLEGNYVTSKKRIWSKVGSLGRNIHQKLLYGFFSKKGNNNKYIVIFTLLRKL